MNATEKISKMEKLLKEFGIQRIEDIENGEGWTLVDITKEGETFNLFFKDTNCDEDKTADDITLTFENGTFKQQWRNNDLEIES